MADQSNQTDRHTLPQKKNFPTGSLKPLYGMRRTRRNNQKESKWLYLAIATAILVVISRLLVQVTPLFKGDQKLTEQEKLLERSSRFAYERFSITLVIDQGGKLEVDEVASAIMPQGFSGFIRYAPRLIALEKGAQVSARLLRAFFAEYQTGSSNPIRFLPAPFSESGYEYQIVAASPDSRVSKQEMPKRLQLIQFFSGAVGIDSKGNEFFRWRLSPVEAAVNHETTFRVVLPPHLSADSIKAKFYRSSPFGDEPLRLEDLQFKVSSGGDADDKSRATIAGRYGNPLKRGEFLQVVLSWPRGYCLAEGSIIQPAQKTLKAN